MIKNDESTNGLSKDILLFAQLMISESEKGFINYIDNNGFNPNAIFEGDSILHKVSQKGYKNVIEKLLEEGADCTLQGTLGRLPIHFIFNDDNKNGEHLEIFKMLLKNYPESINIKNDHGQTPLELACKKGYEKIVEYVLLEADLGQVEVDLSFYNKNKSFSKGIESLLKAKQDFYKFAEEKFGDSNSEPATPTNLEQPQTVGTPPSTAYSTASTTDIGSPSETDNERKSSGNFGDIPESDEEPEHSEDSPLLSDEKRSNQTDSHRPSSSPKQSTAGAGIAAKGPTKKGGNCSIM